MAADIDRLRRLPIRTLVEGIRLILSATPVAGRLGEIRVPTLVLHGTDDVALPRSASDQLVDGIPTARLVMIEGSGHSSPVEAPEAVTAEIDAFLSNLGSPGSSAVTGAGARFTGRR